MLCFVEAGIAINEVNIPQCRLPWPGLEDTKDQINAKHGKPVISRPVIGDAFAMLRRPP